MLFHPASRQISKLSGFCTSLRHFVAQQSPDKMPRGALVVFEGCDRSGKTTQCQKLVEALNEEGTPAKMWRFPDRETAIGKVINDYLERKVELEDHAVHLLFAANRWEAVPKMKTLLSEGTTLIVDRYSFSGVAFTAAKPGLELPWCRQPEVGLPDPDAVLYMTLPPEVAASRAAFGGERYEQTDFQARVAKNYETLKHADWKVIDASKSIDDLHVEIKSLVKQIITDSADKDLGQLWMNDELCEPPAKKVCHVPSGQGDCPKLVTNKEENDSGER